MAEAGKIFHNFTQVEIDEQGNIWLIYNHFESESVIMEMESTSRGEVIYDDISLLDSYDEDVFDDDYL
jgi:hypothetical protein